MLIANKKPIVLIGYEESTVVQEAKYFFKQEFDGDIITLTPEDFLEINDKNHYQYGVAFTLDLPLRKEIIKKIQLDNLDCIKYAHSTVLLYDDIDKVLDKGTCVFPYSTILFNAKIGKFCIIEAYCLIAHHAIIGDNNIIHAGTMIAGRTEVGNNCVFNFKSSVLNALNICDDVTVNAVSTITKNILQPGTYTGTPARKISAC